MMKDLLLSLRPQQWIKNTFIFAALVFAKKLGEPHQILLSCLAFCCFCALSSAVYLINDVRDAEADRQHPIKRNRPIAAGRMRPGVAVLMALVLAGAGLFGCAMINGLLLSMAGAYLGLNILYTLWLKRVAVLDVMSIAVGFVLRAAAGGAAIQVEISSWLIICTFFLALFLGLAKRRHELVLLEDNSARHRANLAEYSPYLLDQMIGIVTTGTLVCYILYTLSEEVQKKLQVKNLYLTIPFVLYGIYRYLYLIHKREGGGNPSSTLVSDRPLLLAVFFWGVAAAAILYFGRR
ncbi:MAG: decaprenyl-phosphate phosphoribosyltransferase [Acidobacteriota bacterium]